MFAIQTTTGQIVALFVVTVLLNAIAGIFSPASTALLPQIVPQESYQQARSYFSMLDSFQSIVGIVLAGILYTALPIETLFFIVGGCYVASAISEMFIRYSSDSEKPEEKLTVKAAFADIRDGFKYLVSLKPVLALMICILFINFFFSPYYENFIPFFVETDVAESGNYLFHEWVEPEMWSSFFSVALGIGSLAMGIVLSAMKQREKTNKIFRYAMMGLAALFVLSAVFYILYKQNVIELNALLIITTFLFLGVGLLLVLVNVPSSASMMRIIDKDKFGKVAAVTSIGSQGLIPLSVFLGGLVLTYGGPIALLSACAVGFVIVALVLFFNRPVREL